MTLILFGNFRSPMIPLATGTHYILVSGKNPQINRRNRLCSSALFKFVGWGRI